MQLIYWFVAEVSALNAGYRVRTLPIVNALRSRGLAIEVLPIVEMPLQLAELSKSAHAVMISKPSDTVTYLCMKHLRQAKVPVFIDLFDNYFSWSPALAKRQLHWQWLRTLSCASTIVTSGDYFRRVIETLSTCPVLVVSDSVPLATPASRASSARKWASTQQIELLWFGISANPYFRAGLDDLSSWGETILRLACKLAPDRSVRLTICTNRVPAVDIVLAEFRSREIDARFVDWSEEASEALLRKSHVVLLPTNLSGFSLSKTHNRCSDALARQCLVLSSPNGPYSDIPGAVFRDLDELASALGEVDADAVAALVDNSFEHLRQRHDLASDSRGLFNALVNARAQTPRAPAPTATGPLPKALIAGQTSAQAVKFARTLGYLVCGFANSGMDLNYDVRLELMADSGGRVSVLLSPLACEVVLRQLSMQRDLDIEDFDDGVECRGAGWRMRLDPASRRLVFYEGLDPSLEQELLAVQTMSRRAPSATALWYVKHTEVLTIVVQRLGIADIDLSVDDEGGWQEFVDVAMPDLASLGKRLEQSWVEFEGNELRWGTPLGRAA